MSFKRVAFQNYRSIEKANLRLGEITIVIGPSDSGKSNVVRALRDWAFNAVGTAFTTEGKSTTRVAVAVGDRHKVVFEKHVKSKHGSTRYVVSDSHEASKPVAYEKVGRSVPEEVSAVTGIRDLSVDDDLKVRPNFAPQGKGWFLLSEAWSASKVSKVVGKISGVEPLILATRDLVRERKRHLHDAKVVRDSIERTKVELASYAGLDAEVEVLEQAEIAAAELDGDRDRLDKAVELAHRIRDLKTSKARTARFVSGASRVLGELDRLDLDEACETLSQAEACFSTVERLRSRRSSAVRAADLARGRLEGCCDMLAKLAKDEGLACPLCGGPAHPGCRKALAKQALSARKSAR